MGLRRRRRIKRGKKKYNGTNLEETIRTAITTTAISTLHGVKQQREKTDTHMSSFSSSEILSPPSSGTGLCSPDVGVVTELGWKRAREKEGEIGVS